MQKRNRPAIDETIASLSVSRDGQPISYNRAPSSDLAPWIARLYVAIVDAPADYRTECGLFNDTAFLRIQLKGAWTADTIRGPMALGRAALFFGPQTRRMPVSVTGGFISIGVSFRPGACHALKGPKISDHLDRVVHLEELGSSGDMALAMMDHASTPEDWLQLLETQLRLAIDKKNGKEPDPITTRFEALSFSDPSASVATFAKDCDVDQRRLERIVRRDFGLPPKQVLRRARALDMASHLRGVADQDEANELALRYYDQSHLIREFTELFGMSPSQFVTSPQPIMTLALESRQARRLEMIERLAPGELRPWQ